MFSKNFDHLLKEIKHYQNYPSLMPFIGENYDTGDSPRILLIAESHYLPGDSVVSRDAETWYNGNYSTLTMEEVRWMHTRNLASCDWKSDGHMIFRELENKMAKYITNFNGRAMNSCAYMNGFQRPSPAIGDSIKYFCKEIDFIKSAEVISEVIRVIEPKLIIFVSKFTWDALAWRITKQHPNTKFDFVCHPGTGGRYWHKKGYKHGVNKFLSLISKKD